MNALWSLINLLVFIQIVTCRDFYLGMFRRNDFLVAQDVIYKARSPFGYTTANYGRLFKCPITYFRVVDRLGMGRGPITTIVRGGLKKKFITVRIKSTYRLPVSVNIYVGCENKKPSTFRTTLTTTRTTTKEIVEEDEPEIVEDTTTISGDDDNATDSDDTTTADTDENKDGTTAGSADVTKDENSETDGDGGTTVAEPETTSE